MAWRLPSQIPCSRRRIFHHGQSVCSNWLRGGRDAHSAWRLSPRRHSRDEVYHRPARPDAVVVRSQASQRSTSRSIRPRLLQDQLLIRNQRPHLEAKICISISYTCTQLVFLCNVLYADKLHSPLISAIFRSETRLKIPHLRPGTMSFIKPLRADVGFLRRGSGSKKRGKCDGVPKSYQPRCPAPSRPCRPHSACVVARELVLLGERCALG